MQISMTKSKSAQASANTMLICCAAVAALICVAQISGSTVVIAASLSVFLLFTIWAGIENRVFPVLLFFLPWSPLMKLYVSGISLYTIALLIACGICVVKNKFRLKIYQVVLAAGIMALTLTAKVLQTNSISNNYLFFMAMLLLFPCVTKGVEGNISFWHITLFFACGIITAALMAQQAAGYGNISNYIIVDSYLTITRLSGFYGDPNFYSAHVSACLAGVQLLLGYENSRNRRIILAIITIMLLYCGLLSASKSFIVVSACQFLVWVPILMEKNGRGGNRTRIFMGVLCATAIVITSSAFKELIRIIDDRFAYAANLSQITTGRTELWKMYIDKLTHNGLLAVFGEGYTSVNLNRKASHNTVIQSIYQFGLVGVPLLAAWVYCELKSVIDEARIKIKWKYALLMAIGIALPWMALDILFFDEFFLLPVYGVFGTIYASKEAEKMAASSVQRYEAKNEKPL